MIGLPERLHSDSDTNRKVRQVNLKRSPCRFMEDVVFRAITEHDEAEAERNKAWVDTGKDLAKLLYEGDGCGARYADALRDIPRVMAGARRMNVCNGHREWLVKIVYPDYYNRKINGTSLSDIENWSLPLHPENIAKITEILRGSPEDDYTPVIDKVREAIICSVVDPLVNPDSKKSVKTHPLRDRLTAYFDFYGEYLNAQNPESDQDRKFLNTLRWGGPVFGTAIGLYVGATYGLSPSSVMKLFQERISGSGLGWIAGWLTKDVMQGVNKGVEHAYHHQDKNALPAGMQPYLHYYADSDKAMSSLLSRAYSDKKAGFSPSNELPDYQEAESLVNKLRKYRREIMADAWEQGTGFAEFKIDGHAAVDAALLGLRGNKSHLHQSLTLVLLSEGSVHHLTLDLPQNRRLMYGVPSELTRKIPNIDLLIARDVIKQIVDQVEGKHPELRGPVKIVALPRRDTVVPAPKLEPVILPDMEEEIEIELPTKVPKRKRLGEAIHLVTSKPQPEKPQPARSNERVYTVRHSEASVRDLMAGASNSDIHIAMEAIKRFEVGGMRARKVLSEPGIIRIRAGDWRIKLDNRNGSMFSLAEIKRRPKAYDR